MKPAESLKWLKLKMISCCACPSLQSHPRDIHVLNQELQTQNSVVQFEPRQIEIEIKTLN